MKLLQFCTFKSLTIWIFRLTFYGEKLEFFLTFQMTRVSNVREIFLRNLVKSMKKFKLLKWWFYVYLRALYNEKCFVTFGGINKYRLWNFKNQLKFGLKTFNFCDFWHENQTNDLTKIMGEVRYDNIQNKIIWIFAPKIND